MPHETTYKMYRETPPQRPIADFVLAFFGVGGYYTRMTSGLVQRERA